MNEQTTKNGGTSDNLNSLVRFVVEERSGIVAVYDTKHPMFEQTNGCHSDFPWCVASWHGHYVKEKGYWEVEVWKIEKARHLCDLLNKSMALDIDSKH